MSSSTYYKIYTSYKACQQQLDGIQAIDYYLARELTQALTQVLSATAQPEDNQSILFHSIIATSEALRSGHTCLKLEEISSTEQESVFWQNADEVKAGYALPKLSDWHHTLSSLAITPDDHQPLVYEQQRLYLRRYWQFETELAARIRSVINISDEQSNINITQAQQLISQLFPEVDRETIDWQKVAVANALLRQFTIIAGGPGTGKTFTVTKILAALQALANNQLKIAMVAPTGKAAQRLNESIQKARSVLQHNQLMSSETLDSIPETASTIHRLLGVIPGSHDFRYHQHRQLNYDVILVDEISMIDLPLMTRLMRAIPPDCRIIMLGDADQLPSVAAGSVLSDLAPRQAAGYSQNSSQQLSKLTGFNIPCLAEGQGLKLDHLTVLQESHRFDGSGEIGNLAKLVIAGNAQDSWAYLKQANDQIELVQDDSFDTWIEKIVEQYYRPLFALNHNEDGQFTPALSIEQAFEQLQQFRFLAATRQGEQSVTAINERVEELLHKKALLSSGAMTTAKEFYHGRPIMVTENHYNLDLYNGDTGLVWLNEEKKLQAVFLQDGVERWLGLGRLPKVETVYAMTIHKTQGSEFKHVGLVLPEQDCLILSRELLYTGITRASERFSLFGAKEVFGVGVKRKVLRYSGLEGKVFGR